MRSCGSISGWYFAGWRCKSRRLVPYACHDLDLAEVRGALSKRLRPAVPHNGSFDCGSVIDGEAERLLIDSERPIDLVYQHPGQVF